MIESQMTKPTWHMYCSTSRFHSYYKRYIEHSWTMDG